jgi:hypothetical protein
MIPGMKQCVAVVITWGLHANQIKKSLAAERNSHQDLWAVVEVGVGRDRLFVASNSVVNYTGVLERVDQGNEVRFAGIVVVSAAVV